MLWHSVCAQGDEPVTPAISGVVAAGTRIELIKDELNGTEGPIALPDGSLIFTQAPINRIAHFAADNSFSTFIENTNGSNALAFDAKGMLYAVEVLQPRVSVIYPADKAKVLADKYEGAGFGRPNDIVVSKHGDLYFTDSGGQKPDPSVNKPAVYRIIISSGKIERIANDIERPNGIQLSPDEKTLYVANTWGEYVLAYPVNKDGSVGARRNFAKLEGIKPVDGGGISSGADGLAVDAKGRLYVASNLGIQVFDAQGKALGTIALPKQPQNLAFAGKNKNILYVVGRGSAYKIVTLTSGFKGRAK
jgi:gluconolactonase